MTFRYLVILFFYSNCYFGQTSMDSLQLIDKATEDCLSKGFIEEMPQCYVIALQSWQKEMNNYYNLLLSSPLGKKQKSKLKDSQTEWTKEKDKEFALIQKTLSTNDANTENHFTAMFHAADLFKNRTLEL